MISGVTPLRLARRTSPFDDREWVFELKYDGFRGLAYVDANGSRLVSRNQHHFEEFASLASSIATAISAENAVMDGEIVCLDEDGRSTSF